MKYNLNKEYVKKKLKELGLTQMEASLRMEGDTNKISAVLSKKEPKLSVDFLFRLCQLFDDYDIRSYVQ
ncbi:MAG: hypothetical protein ACFFDN_04940 [Candidatus Hodarchaeota archaeon]